jgi:hypothetical protein
MQRTLSLTLSLSATFGLLTMSGAYAAPGGGMGMSMPPSASDSQIPRDTAASGLQIGMTIKDSSGAAVGKITKVGQSGGAPAALVDVDGKTVVVLGSTLSVSGNSATSTQTKEEIEASPQPKPS